MGRSGFTHRLRAAASRSPAFSHTLIAEPGESHDVAALSRAAPAEGPAEAHKASPTDGEDVSSFVEQSSTGLEKKEAKRKRWHFGTNCVCFALIVSC